MKGTKTRYTLQVDIYDGTLTTSEIQISKAEYQKQRKLLEAQALEEVHNQGDEYEITQFSTTRSYDRFVMYEETWRNGASDIILTEYKAKDGYSFK